MSFFFVLIKKCYKKILIGHTISIKFSLQSIRHKTKIKTTRKTTCRNYHSPTYFIKFVSSMGKVKRTFLSANPSGSITVEAAFVLPLFVFALITILYLFNLIYIQTTMQIHLENTAKIISSSTCVTTSADVNLNDDENSLLEKVIIDAAGTIAINTLFLTDDIRDFADNSLIVGGADGLSFFGSDVTNTDYPLDIKLSYKVRMPFIPEDVFTFNLRHRCYFKAFNGKELDNNILLGNFYVYVAKNGEVFHKNRLCSHLERFTYLKNEAQLKKEYPNIQLCSFCRQNNNLFSCPQLNGVSYVYVTVEYEAYHNSETCPSLQRFLTRMNYDDAKELYSPCNRCVVYSY